MRDILLLLNENGLIAAAAVCAMLGVLLLLFALTQRGRYRAPQPGPRDDYAKMLILFQTMRDLLEQQKSLARDLNEAIDAKVKYVQDSVDAARSDLSNMRVDVQELSRTLHMSKSQASLPPMTDAEPNYGDDRDHSMNVLSFPESEPPEDNRLDAWVGLDLGSEPDLIEPVQDEMPALDEPSDAEKARAAFRSLLNREETPPHTPTEPDAPKPEPVRDHGNGSGRITPAIKGRVLEYSNAGMTISQIAKEIGIGKGEVRLILSLRNLEGS